MEDVATVTLEGGSIRDPSDFYAAFFEVAAGLIPDYGGRNLEPIVDDLRELNEPLQVVWLQSAASKAALGDWFEQVVAALTNDGKNELVLLSLR